MRKDFLFPVLLVITCMHIVLGQPSQQAMATHNSSWAYKINGDVLEINYGNESNFPQYAALHLSSSYFRMNSGSSSGWGTSVILLPSFWSKGVLYQGAPISVSCQIAGSDMIILFSGTISTLTGNGEIRISPPTQTSISASVSVNVSGTTELDYRAGETYKPVMLSSMHVSSDVWDTKSAYVDSQSFQIPQSGWIIRPPIKGKTLGLRGGTSSWKNNAPTIELDFDKDFDITGYVTNSNNPNDDNIGYWPASDQIISSCNYNITAKLDLPVSIETEINNTPSGFSLNQNFPNPFNPITNIKFLIPQPGFVSLKVYDVLGNEVAILVNEEKIQGTYEVQFDASKLSSGMYFYKLEADSYAAIKKMVFMK